MILPKQTIDYFKLISSKVNKGKVLNKSENPYMIENDQTIRNYECIRDVWHCSNSISGTCEKHDISRTTYYQLENNFVDYGLPGLFYIPHTLRNEPALEKLVLLIKQSRPSLSHIAILRLAQCLPLIKDKANLDIISSILTSYGHGQSSLDSDPHFWGRIQRSLLTLENLLKTRIKGRKVKERKKTFFVDSDSYHKKLECLRELFYSSKPNIKKICIQYNIPLSVYYMLKADYEIYGAWSIIPSLSYGKRESIAPRLQLKIILDKLEHPGWSAQQIVDSEKLHCSRFVVNRVIKSWGLDDKTYPPVVLDRFLYEDAIEKVVHKTPKTAYEILDEKVLLQTRQINRHFELICKKMTVRQYHICDPGPFILAPFVNELGIVQAFETYGPDRLRGKEITNLALLNIFRILAGYRRISHLSNNNDRSVALASGIGIFGSSSKFYEDTIEFKFEDLHKMRCDLVARAKQLGIIEGLQIAFDFHFKEFYGANSKEQEIGKGPAKSGDLVAGFRPHVAWDLATNTIISIAYYQGGVRSSKIIRQFCEQNIFPILDPLAIKEIYMDSEYTKEVDFQYFKEVKCSNGDIYVCLKQNPQIIKLIKPALNENKDWIDFPENNDEDELKTIKVVLPNTKLPLTIAILRDKKTKKNIRCFATTNMGITDRKLLEKYKFRWLIENGLKDLVYSYGLDEIFGKDPERIEFEFYCVMVARLAYEYFLKTLGGTYYNKEDGNKLTLSSMRNMLFEKRNCTIEQDSNKDFKITILDTQKDKLATDVKNMLNNMKKNGENKVLWWNNRSIILNTKNQFETSTC